jgi:predicted phosphatase
MALKDDEGLIKDIALVSYENYDIVGVGENITDAIRNYKATLNNKGNIVAFSSGNTFFEVKDVVTKTGFDVRNGNTYHYFMIKTYPNKLFVTTSNLTNEVALTNVGDSVLLKFKSGDDGEIFAEYFDNLDIKFDKTEAQVGVEQKNEMVQGVKDSINVETNFKAGMESLTLEQKKMLLDQQKKVKEAEKIVQEAERKAKNK